MIGQTISYYTLIEKLGEGGLTTLQNRELRQSGPVRRSLTQSRLMVFE